MKKIIGIFLAVVLIASCRNKEQLGPDLKVTIVEPLAVNTPAVDFAGGNKIFFTAVFENPTAWTITVSAANGAKKILTGVSKEINEANSSWTGTADVIPSFMAGPVTAKLTFQVDPIEDSVPFTISTKRVSDKITDVLVSNFTSSPVQNYGGTIAPGNWPSTYPLTTNTDNAYFVPDGNAYEIMGDPTTPWQGAGSPFVDIVSIAARNSSQNYGTYYPLSADPNNVYFNIMVYGNETPVWLEINFFEVEALDHNSPTNPSADRKLTIKPNWTGWKLVSVKYADLIPADADAAANIRPDKISDIQIVLLSNLLPSNPAMLTTPIRTAFDHITFTHDTPYQP